MNRRVIFANEEIYHVFNRGIEKRLTFLDNWEFRRATEVLEYYRFSNLPLRFSHYSKLDTETKSLMSKKINKLNKYVEILSYCLMPNHFHFLLRQLTDNGISKFIANFTNSYTKYFNTKHNRTGPLFQGLFKAVHIEDDEQFIHVSRYIHLNPVSAYLIEIDNLEKYIWSSYPEYINMANSGFVEKEAVLNFFSDIKHYQQFILDQADYARTLENLKHLLLE